jgi:hypothetical protein
VSQSQNRIGCTKSQRRLPVKKLIKSASSILGLVILFAAAVTLAAGCGSRSKVVRTVTVERKPTVVKTVTAERTAAVVSATGDQRLYGQIKSLERKGDHYELRFDPAWFLSGVTANVAKAEDEHISCQPSACPPVPNDNYRVDEGHRLLTYLVPADARGTVLTKGGATYGPSPGTTIIAAQLAEIVAGKSSLKLFEPLSTGVWILVHVDTVQTFAQQYIP